MADDPHRDLLPVKDGGCINTGRSSVIDQRERHSVCKLDRYQLEDRYLRLVDEVQDLKKLSNTQEDKIKRLATKLMRVAATPRSCLPPTLNVNDLNRVEYLERENAKLNDKITVLKNQILNHTIGRSRSRSRKLQVYPASDPATSRSEIGRIKSSSSHITHELEDEKEGRNNILRIEELEAQNKQLNSRIAELEIQLEEKQAEKQREKTSENVEIIRIWRQMKQQNDELVASQAHNVSLSEQIRELTEQLNEKTKHIKEITTALLAEKERFAEMDEQLAKARSSQLSIREKDEQIKDLISERKILQQHNSELIAITSKFGQVEQENVELKKSIAEHLSDHQSLKSAFSAEQANMSALQAANKQLMKKLHDFQKNIDSLTIQLKTFQTQNERQEKMEPKPQIIRTMDRETSTDQQLEIKINTPEKNVDCELVICKNCSPASQDLSNHQESKKTVNREMQTDDENSKKNFSDIGRDENSKKNFSDFGRDENSKKNFSDFGRDENSKKNFSDFGRDENSKKNFSDFGREEILKKSPKRDRAFQPDSRSASLLPEEMLKLLEEAQINVPKEMKKEISSTISKDYLNSSEPSQSRAYGMKNPGQKNVEEIVESDEKFERHGNYARNPFRNSVSEIGASIEKTCDDIRTSRTESRRESLADSYLSTSLEHSETSVIPEMEDEDLSSDISDSERERRISSTEKRLKKVGIGSKEDDSDKADTDSVKEFNSLIRNNIILSQQDSCTSVQDLGAVFSDDNWHEYKRRSIPGQAKSSEPPSGTDEKSGSSNLRTESSSRGNNTIIIRIESLSLDHKCSLLEDPEIHQLYVEFSFLGYHGADLETISVAKPTGNEAAYFNYMRKFEIDEEQHQMQRSIMRAMMSDDDNPTVKFTVVSEPLPEEMEIKECVEVGYAFFNVRDHVLSGGSNEVSLTIVNLTQTEPIGVLKITLLGVEVIRRCMSDLV